MNPNDESSRSEDLDARWARAAMQSLSVEAPPDLKAELKRLARVRRQEPSIWDGLRAALSGGAWAYGAGAAFAAATVALALWNAVPGAGSPGASGQAVLAAAAPETPAAPAAAPFTRAAASADAADLAALWTDDDGEDHDEG